MADNAKFFGAIEDSIVEIKSDQQRIDVDGVIKGVTVTGFIDVEKIICLGYKRCFIEKKLPFQTLILCRPIFFSEEGFGVE